MLRELGIVLGRAQAGGEGHAGGQCVLHFLRHALLGGITAALLWELTRRVLVWYFSTLSQVNVVYGSLTTAIVVLLSL